MQAATHWNGVGRSSMFSTVACCSMSRLSGPMPWRCVRVLASVAKRPTTEPSKASEDSISVQVLASFSMPSGVGSPATAAPLMAPIEVPATRSGLISASTSAWSIPTSWAPSWPPPPRTNAVLPGVTGRSVAEGGGQLPCLARSSLRRGRRRADRGSGVVPAAARDDAARRLLRQATRAGPKRSSAVQVPGPTPPPASSPCCCWKLVRGCLGALVEHAVHRHVLSGGAQVLLGPDHQVAARAPAQARVAGLRAPSRERAAARRARASRGWPTPASPTSRRRWRRTERTAGGSGGSGCGAGASRSGRAGRWCGRRRRCTCRWWPGAVDAVADRLPVHLRHVELGAAGAEEDGVGEARVVVDVGEAGEADRVVGPDPGAQAAQVGLGRGVPALVVGLGVDHQAVGAALAMRAPAIASPRGRRP